jgi:hypothetical protein
MILRKNSLEGIFLAIFSYPPSRSLFRQSTKALFLNRNETDHTSEAQRP